MNVQYFVNTVEKPNTIQRVTMGMWLITVHLPLPRSVILLVAGASNFVMIYIYILLSIKFSSVQFSTLQVFKLNTADKLIPMNNM